MAASKASKATKAKAAEQKKRDARALANMHAVGFREGVSITETLIARWLRSRDRFVLARMVEAGTWEHDKKGRHRHG
jgi:hypothetical protein